jgi:hypothetical protein
MKYNNFNEFKPILTAEGGASGDEGRLYKGVHPHESKSYYLKKIPTMSSKSTWNNAVDEVRAQEFLRLLIPGQPKTELVVNTYVVSLTEPQDEEADEDLSEYVDVSSAEPEGDKAGEEIAISSEYAAVSSAEPEEDGAGEEIAISSEYVASEAIPDSKMLKDTDTYRFINPRSYGTQRYLAIKIPLGEIPPSEDKREPNTCYFYLDKEQGKVKYLVKENKEPESFPSFGTEEDDDDTTLEDFSKFDQGSQNKLLFAAGYLGGCTGLGGINIGAGWILDDPDHRYGNVLCHSKTRHLYKIDGGRAGAGGGRSSPFYAGSDKHEKLLENKFYRREIHEAILKFLLLPDNFMDKFLKNYHSEKVYTAFYTTFFEPSYFFAKKSYLQKRLFSNQSLSVDLSPYFLTYCLTAEAKQDLAQYKKYLETFETPQGKLLSQYPDLFTEMDALFKKLQEDILEYNSKSKAAPAQQIESSLTSTTPRTEEEKIKGGKKEEPSKASTDKETSLITASLAGPGLFSSTLPAAISLKTENENLPAP